MPPISRPAAALSLIAAMTLTGANVAFARAIVAEFPVYVFVLFRFVVASLALAFLVRGEPGPKLSAMRGAEWRDLTLMALLGKWNWWSPRPLRRLHARVGISEAAVA